MAQNKQLLVIRASILGKNGNSNTLVDEYLAHWHAANPGCTVLERDFSASPIPHLTQEVFMAFATPDDKKSEQQKQAVSLSEELVAEFLAADEIVLGLPMYNLGIPSSFKAYIDHIGRVGKTFRYTEKGPVGLAGDKKVMVLAARGGLYANTPADTQTPYIQSIFGFFGISDQTFVYAEGLNISPEMKEKGMAGAVAEIKALF